MVAIKSISDIAAKWARVTPARTEDYEQGVRSPRRDWANETSGAESRYSEGVQAAISNGSFARGVSNAGTAKWQAKAISKGVSRWGPGVRDAQPDFEAGFRPYRDIIESTTLPARYPKGDPRNIERVAALANALHARKVSGG